MLACVSRVTSAVAAISGFVEGCSKEDPARRSGGSPSGRASAPPSPASTGDAHKDYLPLSTLTVIRAIRVAPHRGVIHAAPHERKPRQRGALSGASQDLSTKRDERSVGSCWRVSQRKAPREAASHGEAANRSSSRSCRAASASSVGAGKIALVATRSLPALRRPRQRGRQPSNCLHSFAACSSFAVMLGFEFLCALR